LLSSVLCYYLGMSVEVAYPEAVAESRYLTVAEFAERVRLNPQTVRKWLRSGRIHGYSLGSDRGGYRIPESEVDRLLTGREPDRP
jgi:excisionase family DNA binding protein